MITFIKGILEEKSPDGISVDVNGVGYFIALSKKNILELPDNESVKVFTTLIHREDSMKLYGFITKEERQVFNLLISVSGVGAKTAMDIFSSMSVSDIISSIYSNKPQKLTKAQGIGKKTAERIILDLKEKIAKFKNVSTTNIPINKNLAEYEETEAALMALGYSDSEIQKSINWLISNHPKVVSSDDMIRETLSWLSEI